MAALAVLTWLPQCADALPAFPGAEGVGAGATGGARVPGRKPVVYHVTTLDDSGPGTFRDAVSAPGRIVVFDVGGAIHLAAGSPVSVAGDLTIAGETAPGGGIAIDGAEVSFSNRRNIICRHIRFRQTTRDPERRKSAVGMDSASDIIMDHVSIEFGQWDNIDCNRSSAVTFQEVIDADPIGQKFNAHADSDVTWYRNLWSSAHNRNPLAKGNIEYVNNVLYNFQAGFTAHTDGVFSMDIVNNCFVYGPAGRPGTPFFQIGGKISIYGAGNYLMPNKDGTLRGAALAVPGAHPLSAPWNAAVTNSLPTLSAVDAWAWVVSTAGALPWNRDPVDAQVIDEARSLGAKGRSWSSEAETGLPEGGLGELAAARRDADADGVPAYWKAAMTRGGSTAAYDALAPSASGYLNIEDYLHFMAAPHAVTMRDMPVAIDLSRFASGFLHPVFSIGRVVNGSVAIAPDGHTAQFNPARNFAGLGQFDFAVPYPDGAQAAFTVNVCVSSVAP